MTVTGIQTFADLKGKRVGAWGGSIVTAKGVSAMTGVPYQIVTMKDQPSAIAALNAGQVDAVLAVVGQPATWVKGLSELNMVPVPSNAKLSAIYAPAKLFYPNLSAQSVSTFRYKVCWQPATLRPPKKSNCCWPTKNAR